MSDPYTVELTNLTLEDRDPQAYLNAAILSLGTSLPDVQWREGHTEVALLEAMAAELSELGYLVNRLPDGILEAVLKLFGLERDAGTPPTATLTLTTNPAFRAEVPIGTRFLLNIPGTDERMAFLADAGLVIAEGTSTGTVAVTGDRATSAANGVPANTALVPLDSVLGLEAATLATPIVGGLTPEDLPAFLARGIRRLSRLSEALVLAAHFQAAAEEDPRVGRALAVDLYDPSAGGSPGDNPGHVTLAVLDNDAQPLSAAVKDQLHAALDAAALVNLVLHVEDIAVTAVNVTATVRGRVGYDQATIQGNVTAAINAALDPLTVDLGGTNVVYRLSLVGAIDGADGVARVETVLLNSVESDASLPGVAALPKPGVVTVNVNY